ncbi:hypothetical protein [Mastigocladopsis repens]|nr:hypothetical protein [Mastigocladopsis repens]
MQAWIPKACTSTFLQKKTHDIEMEVAQQLVAGVSRMLDFGYEEDSEDEE